MGKKPEVMSPAGYWPQMRAAIEAGADAVYFGLRHFSARAKTGFSLEDELPEALRLLHSRGVKGYVTFNTLVFDHELRAAIETLEKLAEAGPDAIIVQDLGIAALAREIAPDLVVHGSTQMSITSAEGVRFAGRLGARRVVLARELSLKDIGAIIDAGTGGTELEIFVHGALCVSYSGQCFSSEAWGGRSANRGQCAQACRLPYELLVDGAARPLGDARYLLSPGDLYALKQIPEIVALGGIASLKIEGRYKDADYVTLTTQAYRQAVDEAWAGHALAMTPADELRLEQVYSRGMGPQFLAGTDHQAVVRGRAGRHRGLLMGRVEKVDAGGAVTLIPEAATHGLAPLKAGDGVVFDAADWRSPQEAEEGGRIYEVDARGKRLTLRFGAGAVNAARIRPGDLVWRTHDPELDKYVKSLGTSRRGLPVHVAVTAREGERLRMVWTVGEVHRVEVESPEVLAHAAQRPVDAAVLRDQLGRLGGTAFELGELQVEIAGAPFAPVSLLNQMRRQAVEALTALQSAPRPGRRGAVVVRSAAAVMTREAGAPELHVLVRTGEQLEAAIALRPASITLDYLELYGLAPSVARVRAAGIAVRVASPRVLKPAEERIVHFLRKLDCAILVRSAGLLDSLVMAAGAGRPELFGDFSLNAANARTAELLLELGLARLTPTHDLNADQIAGLARAVDPQRLEPALYHHLPVFHTEHCVFCRFLSSGTTHENCGHPCERHRVALRDERGMAHPVMADVGCRNTVFGAEAQQAAAHLPAWRAAGLRHFRVEFVHESAAEVRRVMEALRAGLEGRMGAAELARELQRAAPQGVTEGSLFVPKGYAQFPILP